ncbi:hypothetical protein [Tepidibacter mesophilus]|uniref:hypothetical protein n=1 Tax=Tepidibacter mesophilus TaxID=655607 RepID=UPI000C086D06|nr:hypothetical protein [Tepidibacter mesophilus]
MNLKWKETEKIVAAFEKRISEESEVMHNVILTDLSGDSNGRQCDIVIRSGKYPRETVTIVEVQDRKSQLNITTFDGFVEKMRSVGAQHLIVVSKCEFPISVRRRAMRLGPTVRLINFSEMMKGEFVIEFIDDSVTICNHFLDDFVVRIKDIGDQEDNLDLVFSILEEGNIIFERDDLEYSPSELIFHCLKHSPGNYKEGKHKGTIKISIDERVCIKSIKSIPVGIEFDITVNTSISKLDLKCFEYKQQDLDDPLLWYAEGLGKIDGEDARIGISFTYNENISRYDLNLEVLEGPFYEGLIELARID